MGTAGGQSVSSVRDRHRLVSCAAWLVTLGLALVACESEDTRSVDWEIELDDCARGVSAMVSLRVLRDSCDGLTPVYVQSIVPGSPVLSTPELQAGRYGFEAIALDGDGERVGYDCVELVLPLRGEGVRVVLESSACDLTIVADSSVPDAGAPGDSGLPPAIGEGVCEDDPACADGLECTEDCLFSDGCAAVPMPGFCVIDGACYANGESSPDDPCMACDTKASSIWWPAPRGVVCGDDRVCDGIGHCVETR